MRYSRSFRCNGPAPTVSCCGLCSWTVELAAVVLLCCAFSLHRNPPLPATHRFAFVTKQLQTFPHCTPPIPKQLLLLHPLPPHHPPYNELRFKRPPELYETGQWMLHDLSLMNNKQTHRKPTSISFPIHHYFTLHYFNSSIHKIQ